MTAVGLHPSAYLLGISWYPQRSSFQGSVFDPGLECPYLPSLPVNVSVRLRPAEPLTTAQDVLFRLSHSSLRLALRIVLSVSAIRPSCSHCTVRQNRTRDVLLLGPCKSHANLHSTCTLACARRIPKRVTYTLCPTTAPDRVLSGYNSSTPSTP